MRIINSDKPFRCEEKRFYVPGARIETRCGRCKKPAVLDLSEQYMSYPDFNRPFTEYVGCSDDACGHETPLEIRLRIEIEAA